MGEGLGGGEYALLVLIRAVVAGVANAVEAFGLRITSDLFLLAAFGVQGGALKNAEGGDG